LCYNCTLQIIHTSAGVVLRKSERFHFIKVYWYYCANFFITNFLLLENARKCKVLFSYKPANRDELELNIDDVIEVLGEVEEGWWKGELRNEVSTDFITHQILTITFLHSTSLSLLNLKYLLTSLSISISFIIKFHNFHKNLP